MLQTQMAQNHDLSGFELSKLVYNSSIARTFNLKLSSFAVLTALTHHYNQEKKLVFPSIRLLCERLNCAKSTTILAIDELISKGLILKLKKGKHNAYSFTTLMMNSLNSKPNRTEIQTNENNDTDFETNKSEINVNASEIQTNVRTEIQTLTYNSPEEIKEEEKKENELFSFLKNPTEFQKRYLDVFQELSENELQEYKKLEGFDKEPWLIGKRRKITGIKKAKEQQKINTEYVQNATCPRDWTKEEQIAYYDKLSPMMRKISIYAQEIKSKLGLNY